MDRPGLAENTPTPSLPSLASGWRVERVGVASGNGWGSRGAHLAQPLPQNGNPAREERGADAALAGIEGVLLTPLAPVIEHAPFWRPGIPAIPDTALPALGTAIRKGLAGADGLAAELACGRIEGHGGSAPTLLWSWAARILESAIVPTDWAASGLSPERYPAIAAGAAAVLHAAAGIAALQDADRADTTPSDPLLREVLDATAARGPAAWSLVVQAMLARAADPAALLRLLTSPRSVGSVSSLRAATEAAIAALLDRLARSGGGPGPIGALPLNHAVDEARRVARLLRAVAGSAGPERRRHAEALRIRLAAACEERFRTGMAESLIMPLKCLAGPPDRTTVRGLETVARDLRRLEAAARALGSAGCETLVRQASTMIAALDKDVPLRLVDRVRLVEILSGPEDALALLRPAGPGAEAGAIRSTRTA
jgi:hypothetical protein